MVVNGNRVDTRGILGRLNMSNGEDDAIPGEQEMMEIILSMHDRAVALKQALVDAAEQYSFEYCFAIIVGQWARLCAPLVATVQTRHL